MCIYPDVWCLTTRQGETPETMRIQDILTNDERLDLLRKNNAEGGVMVISTWSFIFFILSLAGHFPSVLSIGLVFILLPGRQLSLAVLMHEAGHGTLFTSRRLNQWVGQWLCALPTLGNLSTYAAGHVEHHRLAGTRRDPDLPNYRAYPITWESFRRKVWRVFTGQTGIKLLLSLAKGGAGNMEQPGVSGRFLLVKQVFVQTVIFGLLFLAGIGWTWLLWFASFMTTYMLVIRLRQIAEHAAVPDLYDPDPRLNTRTVNAPLWQRFLIAPSFVNYHLEHHLIPGVPCYNLPALRTLLETRGFFLNTPTCTSYHRLLRSVIT